MLYLVDFEHVAILPLSFMTYALDQPRPVCTAIKDSLDLPQGNLVNMRLAGYYFMLGGRKIGKLQHRKARQQILIVRSIGLPLQDNENEGQDSSSSAKGIQVPHVSKPRRGQRAMPDPPEGMRVLSRAELGIK